MRDTTPLQPAHCGTLTRRRSGSVAKGKRDRGACRTSRITFGSVVNRATTVGPAVELRGVRKHYGFRQPWVLRDVNFVVDRGSIVELAGSNGAGKSTLLRILAGATRPTGGHRRSTRPIAVGYMPERLTAPAFSARDYLNHHVRLRRLDQRDGGSQILELVERLDAGPLLAERLGVLSKGSLQKIVAIQSLLGQPDMLVLDEPFASLDASARGALWELITECADDGTAVVFCEHRDRPQRVSDRRLVLADGVLSEESSSAGVSRPRPSGDGLRLVVHRDVSDREIGRLLNQGWHIVGVRVQSADEICIEATKENPAG